MNQQTLTHLQQLEADSIHVMREVVVNRTPSYALFYW